jgi:hypothetical protein
MTKAEARDCQAATPARPHSQTTSRKSTTRAAPNREETEREFDGVTLFSVAPFVTVQQFAKFAAQCLIRRLVELQKGASDERSGAAAIGDRPKVAGGTVQVRSVAACGDELETARMTPWRSRSPM